MRPTDRQPEPDRPPRLPRPLHISLLYLLIGAGWIFFSDRIAAGLASSEEQLHLFSSLKGWLFIAVTALLLYLALRRDARSLAAHADKLQRSEEHLKRAQSTAGIGSWEKSAGTHGRMWSDSAFDLLGLPPRKTGLALDNYLTHVHPDDRKRFEQAFQDALAPDAPPFESTYRILRADNGEIRFIHECCIHVRDAGGTVVKSTGTVQDITELRQAENELNRGQQLVREVVEAVPDPLWLKDGHGRYLLCNHRFEQFVGAAKDQIIGQTDYDLLDREIADFFRRHDGIAIENKGPSFNEEWVTFASDGHRELLETIKTPLYRDDGELIGVLGIGHNITPRKAAEDARKESEEKYLRLFNNAPLPYQSLNEDGCFIDVNPAWLRILGYEREEVIGKWFGDFLHPDFVQHFEANFPAFKKRGYVKDVQFRIRHKNGTYRHIEFEGCIGYLPDGSFRQTYCVFMDITERKLAEEALRENEQRYRTLIEQTGDCMFMHDQKGNIIDTNNHACEFLGYTRDELLSMSIADIDPDAAERRDADRLWDRELYTPVVFETRHRKKGGEIYHAEVRHCMIRHNGEIVGFAFSRDITERHSAEIRLKQSEEKLRGIVENSTNMFYSHTADGILTYVSAQVQDILGYQPEEALKHWTDFASDDPANARGMKLIRKAIDTGEAQPPYEFQFIHKDGRPVWVEVREAPVVKNGKTTAIVGAMTDVTERKQAEKELQRYQDELERKVDERTRELRTIVNAMAGRENRMADLKLVIQELTQQLKQAGLTPASRAQDDVGSAGEEPE